MLLGAPSSFAGAPSNYCEKVIMSFINLKKKRNLSLSLPALALLLLLLSDQLSSSSSCFFFFLLLLPGSSCAFFFIACVSSLCLFFFFVEEVAEVACGGAARKLPRRATVVEEVCASTVEVSTVNLTFFCSSVAGDGGKRCRKSLGALRIK